MGYWNRQNLLANDLIILSQQKPQLHYQHVTHFTSYACVLSFFSAPEIENASSPVFPKWSTTVLQIFKLNFDYWIIMDIENWWHLCDDCAVAIIDAMAQLGLLKCSMNVWCIWPPCLVNIEKFWFFLLSMFGEMFGTFDRGLICRPCLQGCMII